MTTTTKTENKVYVELCRSNGNGSPTIIEWREVTRQEADELLAKVMVNGYFWREPQGE